MECVAGLIRIHFFKVFVLTEHCIMVCIASESYTDSRKIAANLNRSKLYALKSKNTMQMIIEVIFFIFETEIICSTYRVNGT